MDMRRQQVYTALVASTGLLDDRRVRGIAEMRTQPFK